MKFPRDWDFFSHETNLETLQDMLQSRYGIDMKDASKIPADLNIIYKISLKLCKHLGGGYPENITDSNFFVYGETTDTHLFEYLATDALFHIRKEYSEKFKTGEERTYKSRNQFFDRVKEDCDRIGIFTFAKNIPHFGKLTNQFLNSIYRDLLGRIDTDDGKDEIPGLYYQ